MLLREKQNLSRTEGLGDKNGFDHMTSSELFKFGNEPELINANPKHLKVNSQEMINKFGENAF